jgi:uncharacterized membrane protein
MINRLLKMNEWSELGLLNVIGFSVSGLIMNYSGVVIGVFVGISVIALNVYKIYGAHLDNKLKKKKLEK